MNLASTALLLVDLQNDFLHAAGAYARGGQANSAIAALPARLKPFADAIRQRGGLVAATLFTLVPGRGGEPIISPHLKGLRPFLGKGDFVEKIAYSAFYMTRLEWLLRKSGIERLYVGGIVTNGGVASTVRDAHVREIDCTVLSDGCAAFAADVHRAAIEGLRPVARIMTVAQAMDEIGSG
jgi:ureidoacrylate peracid hydrolase